MLIAMLLSMTAWAQDAQPDQVYAAEDIISERFPDDESTGPIFTRGTRLDVLYVAGDELRVRHGSNFGWVPKSATMREDPNAMDSLMNNPDVQELLKQLESQAPPADEAPAEPPSE